MRLTSLFLADHAEALRGKFYVTGGGWDAINVRRLPAVHPHMCVAVALEVGWNDTDVDHEIDVKLLDEDGRSLLPGRVGGKARAARQPTARPGDTAPLLLVFKLLGVKFERAGDYNVTVEVDSVPVGSVRLKVRQINQPR